MEKFIYENNSDTVIVLFHGTGGNEYQLLSMTAELFPTSDVISFLGEEGVGSDRRFFAPLIEGKIERSNFESVSQRFLTEELPAIANTYKKIIFMGYSNGANFILGLAEQQPELADLLILLHPSNLDYQFSDVVASTKIILTSGAQDTITTAGDTLRLSKELERHFDDVTFLLLDGDHQVTPQEIDLLKEKV